MESVFSSRTSLKKKLSHLLFVFLVLNCFTEFRCVAAKLLPDEEVDALQTISNELPTKLWYAIDKKFCSDGNVTRGDDSDQTYINIACNCNDTVCHVTSIKLKGQNLAGEIPAKLTMFSDLQEIDLTRNYINGSIPRSFAQLNQLRILSLLGNRISGWIPKEIGDIHTLEELVLENNQLGGPLPPNLGNLTQLRRLRLSANHFTGTLPEQFSNLKNLTEFSIDGSELSGKIPDWIGNWTLIERLDMQGTSMEGPLPSTISKLKNLTQLRISDLNGLNYSSFPDLKDMKNLKDLVLRNCLINGKIPDYISNLTKLRTLDLSFNMLTGNISEKFKKSDLDHMFLNNNSLTGTILPWISNRRGNFIDVSYNNFTSGSGFICDPSTLNVASSISSSAESNLNNNYWCMKKDLPCPTNLSYHSLFINCGGSETSFDGKDYEADLATEGPSYFYVSSGPKWAYSSTGVFMGNKENGIYVAKNSLSLNVTDEIYGTARLAPTSLKYYALCLSKGSYKVRLHFAEIMFSNDQTFSSLGERIFDVSIQGKLELKNFNIMEEAQSPGKGIIKEFKDVLVNGSTLEIHLYWSGKGTNAIPNRGVYGPLISAISVTPNSNTDTGLSVGAIVGIVVASCVVLVLTLFVLRMKGYLGGKTLKMKVRSKTTRNSTYGGFTSVDQK